MLKIVAVINNKLHIIKTAIVSEYPFSVNEFAPSTNLYGKNLPIASKFTNAALTKVIITVINPAITAFFTKLLKNVTKAMLKK